MRDQQPFGERLLDLVERIAAWAQGRPVRRPRSEDERRGRRLDRERQRENEADNWRRIGEGGDGLSEARDFFKDGG